MSKLFEVVFSYDASVEAEDETSAYIKAYHSFLTTMRDGQDYELPDDVYSVRTIPTWSVREIARG